MSEEVSFSSKQSSVHKNLISKDSFPKSKFAIYNPNNFQGSSKRAKQVFILSANYSVGPGYYNPAPHSPIKGVGISPKRESLTLMKEYLKDKTPGPGAYSIEKPRDLRHFTGKVELKQLIHQSRREKISPGPGSYDPRPIESNKSISFPVSRYDKRKGGENGNSTDKTEEERKIIEKARKIASFTTFGNAERGCNKSLEESIGPGQYQIHEETSKIPQKFRTGPQRNFSLPTLGPGPGKYNISKDLIIRDKSLELYRKLHEKAFKNENEQAIGLEKTMRRCRSNGNRVSIYELVKKAVSLKDKALVKIRSFIEKSEKTKLRASLEKRNLGFTTSVRKNECLSTHQMIDSPGPIYNIRERFAKNAVKVSIPVQKRRSMWEPPLEIPGPGTYNLRRAISKHDGEAFKELSHYVKRQKILKSIIKKNSKLNNFS